MSIRWTGPLDWTPGLTFDLELMHAQKKCTCTKRSVLHYGLSSKDSPSIVTMMSGKTGGNGTCSSPIVLDSDSETESGAETLMQVPGSPLLLGMLSVTKWRTVGGWAVVSLYYIFTYCTICCLEVSSKFWIVLML